MRYSVPAAALALALTACGARQVPEAPPAPRHIVDRVQHEEHFMGTVERNPISSSLAFELPAAPADAFRALAEAYGTLGIELETISQSNRLIGNANFRVRRTLGGMRLSRYFDCGRTVTGPTADSYTLTLDVRSQILDGDGEGSRLVTWIRATAAAPGRAREAPIVCSSTGGLEDRLRTELIARL